MSHPSDSDHEYDQVLAAEEAEEREANKPYVDPDDYHDEGKIFEDVA